MRVNQFRVDYDDFKESEDREDYHEFTFNDTLFGPHSVQRNKVHLLINCIKRRVHVLRSNGCSMSDLATRNRACKHATKADLADVPVLELLIMQETLESEIIKLN
jgi:hypothetical protein